jgi:hypothetical protein
MRARLRSRASGQRDADCRGYGFGKERGDSDNIAAFQAILSDVVCGVVGGGGVVMGVPALVKSTASFRGDAGSD